MLIIDSLQTAFNTDWFSVTLSAFTEQSMLIGCLVSMAERNKFLRKYVATLIFGASLLLSPVIVCLSARV